MPFTRDSLEAIGAVFWTITIIGVLVCAYLVLAFFEAPWGWFGSVQSLLTNPSAPIVLVVLFCLGVGLTLAAGRPTRIIMQIPLLAGVVLLTMDDSFATVQKRVKELEDRVKTSREDIARLSGQLGKVRESRVARQVRTFTIYGKRNQIRDLPFAAADSACFRSYYHGDKGGGEEFTLAIGADDGMYDIIYKSQQSGYLVEVTCVRFGKVDE